MKKFLFQCEIHASDNVDAMDISVITEMGIVAAEGALDLSNISIHNLVVYPLADELIETIAGDISNTFLI